MWKITKLNYYTPRIHREVELHEEEYSNKFNDGELYVSERRTRIERTELERRKKNMLNYWKHPARGY